MPKYLLVINQPNRTATIHRGTCVSLGGDPLAQTTSAERVELDDGFEAVALAAERMPASYRLCGHCLKTFRELMSTAARG